MSRYMPCPFCGHTKISSSVKMFNGELHGQITCEVCRAKGPLDTSPVRGWNERKEKQPEENDATEASSQSSRE